MSVEYIPYRRKRLLQEMKTCKAYMRKVASGLLELSPSHIDHRANMLEASVKIIDQWIEEVENGK